MKTYFFLKKGSKIKTYLTFDLTMLISFRLKLLRVNILITIDKLTFKGLSYLYGKVNQWQDEFGPNSQTLYPPEPTLIISWEQ